MTPQDRDALYKKFNEAVNMTASELKTFLDTSESKKVGQKFGGGNESIGHASGRHIVKILQTKKDDLTPADYEHMKKVTSYIARHTAQGGPKTDKDTSFWRYSLMNWGHDPLKT